MLAGAGDTIVANAEPSPKADSSTSKADNPWAKRTTPAPGPARSIGGYSAGCVRGAEALPLSGPGFQVARPARARHFGHPLLIDMVRTLGARMDEAGLGPLMIGDLGQPRGGPAPNGHSSHQTGLDADIWFWAPARAYERPLPRRALRGLEPRIVVSKDDDGPNDNWSPRVAKALELAAGDPRVDRIFVNPLIKRELCGTTQGERAWLRKLRPWWGHDAHFHVRLACPDDSPDCTPQSSLPRGDGCDEIAWWFDEAKQAARSKRRGRYRDKVRGLPELPPECAPLLQ